MQRSDTPRHSIGVFRDGGYAEYVTLRSEAITLVPEDMDPAEVAPLLCAGITTFSKCAGILSNFAYQHSQSPQILSVTWTCGLRMSLLSKALGRSLKVLGIPVSNMCPLEV